MPNKTENAYEAMLIDTGICERDRQIKRFPEPIRP